MSGLWTPWDSNESDLSEYDHELDGPEADMWRSIASAAAAMGYHQSSCPVCSGRGWFWETREGKWR